jgi:hypothetical protein
VKGGVNVVHAEGFDRYRENEEYAHEAGTLPAPASRQSPGWRLRLTSSTRCVCHCVRVRCHHQVSMRT